MDRRALEALSSEDLQRLIAEAVAVLAARHAGAGLVDIRKGLNNELNSDINEEQAETSQQPGSGSVAAPPSRQSVSGKPVVVMPSKRSGVRGVAWEQAKNAWRVSWIQGGQHKRRYLFARRHAEQHQGSYEEDDAEALRDAVAFREGLARRWVINRQSCKQGVSWDSRRKRWKVCMVVSGKWIWDCGFRAKDDTPEEIERARLAAVERRREMEAEHLEVVTRRDAQPWSVETKESGVAGVTWRRFEGCWVARIQRLGKTQLKRFKPEDFSPEAVESARLLAVKWRRDMENHKAAEAAH